MKNQKNLFRIPDDVSYLNCAFMSPIFKEAEAIGHQSISQKCLPYEITSNHFFEATNKTKQLFASLIEADDFHNIAIIPSVSYGIATVANNIHLEKDDEILIVGEQFPSNVYSWQKIADKAGAKILIVKPTSFENRGENWNKNILKAINNKTKVVAIPHVHWSDGTLFDLKSIRKKTFETDSLLIIDGTQSVGALPFSVKEIQPDALICASYKWLFGAYSIGLAYYSDALCQGEPIEENWINRKNSEDFSSLMNYESDYQPKAGRYNIGEMSNFALTPMLVKSLEQLLAWKAENIQQYCNEISKEAIKELRDLGCFIEAEKYRGYHLFGIYLPKKINLEILKSEFTKQKVYVSFRGNAIRVASHVYNVKEDFDKLVNCFKNSL